jgi:transglutaminase-like putative cysteine protease
MDDPNIHFCYSCGRQLTSEERFCPGCGNSLQPAAAQPISAPIPPPVVRKRSRAGPVLAFIVVVIVIVASLGYLLGDELGITDSTYSVGEGNQVYRWDFEGTDCWLYTNLTYANYMEYQHSSVPRRLTSYDYSLCTSYVTSGDPIIMDIAAKLQMVADHLKLDDESTIELALAFSQTMTYRYDNETAGADDYWRFPVETLYVRLGDCEDKSFLFAAIVEAMGFDAVCLVFPDHLAVGVACPGAYGTYYDKFGSQYYYCETTSIGWTLGEIPESYGSANIVQVE